MWHPANPRLLESLGLWRAPRGGGKGGGGSSSTSTRVEYSPEEQAVRNKIFDIGGSLYEGMAPTAGTYRGPAPVGFDPATTAAQGLQVYNTGQTQALTPQAAQAANFGLTGALDVNSNPYLGRAMEAAIRPQVQNFQQNVMPSLAMGGLGTGSYSSSRQGVAEGLAAQALINKVGDTTAQMGSSAYNTGLDASLQTLRALPSVGQFMSAPASMLSQVGAQRENLAQEAENYGAAGRTAEVNQPWELLNSYANLVSGMSNPTTIQTGNTPRQGISPLQGVGAGLGLLSLASKLPS